MVSFLSYFFNLLGFFSFVFVCWTSSPFAVGFSFFFLPQYFIFSQCPCFKNSFSSSWLCSCLDVLLDGRSERNWCN